MPDLKSENKKLWRCTRRERLVVLERRLRFLQNKRGTDDFSRTEKSYLANEIEALEWALPLLYEIIYPEK